MSKKIISTIGPSSYNSDILNKLKSAGSDFFRINLSHTSSEILKEQIDYLSIAGLPLIVDTEGSQIRTGNLKDIHFKENDFIKIYDSKITCDKHNLSLTPNNILKNLSNGCEIHLAFGSAKFIVKDTSNLSNEGYIICQVIHGGLVGSRKAVHISKINFGLPDFSEKDLTAVRFAKDMGIKYFTLSFMECAESVMKIRKIHPGAIIYSKIESKKGLDNLEEIMSVSDGILIDRGDLSSDIPIQKIPFVQKYIIEKCRAKGIEVFVATDTLQNMFDSLRPNAADANDMVNTLIDGATGIALTKETAVGRHPVSTVKMLRRIMSQVEKLDSHEINSQQNFIHRLIEDETL
tara:strand:- start:610 stop:1653 length:1044 start_codon:yes stop_codon:yes gene_type:complete